MTTDNAKSRFTTKSKQAPFKPATGRIESPSALGSINYDDVSNKYQMSEKDEVVSNQFKTYDQTSMQPKYDMA